MEFQETLTIQLPDLAESLGSIAEHRSPLERALVIEVAAIHEGMTQNYTRYSATELAAALPSWTSPYPKPVILHHDPFTDPLGRIIGARMDKEDDGTPYMRLQVAVTDSTAVQKVKDQRYLTGSVGGKAGKANCTVCQADWSNASMFELPCKHQRGKTYKGQVAAIEMGDISFREYSFVNMPADQRSGVRAVHAPMESEEAIEAFQPARFYCLDMQRESVTEFGETDRNVLEGAKTPTDATSVYLGLKGAFLSALAEDLRQAKETGMGVKPGDVEATPPEVKEEEDDILSVAEELSADLSATAEADDEGDGDANEGEAEGEEGEASATADEPDPAPEEESEPSEEPESESEVADGGNEDSEGEESEEEGAEESAGDAGQESVEPEPDGHIVELEALRAQIAGLEARNTTLSEENGRLRSALKRGLAERVVDTKIALGLFEADDRETQMSEHMERSAASLADSLRDLSTMPRPRTSYTGVPTIQPNSAAIEGDPEREVVVELKPAATSPKPLNPEDVLVDVLMGRRPL